MLKPIVTSAVKLSVRVGHAAARIPAYGIVAGVTEHIKQAPKTKNAWEEVKEKLAEAGFNFDEE